MYNAVSPDLMGAKGERKIRHTCQMFFKVLTTDLMALTTYTSGCDLTRAMWMYVMCEIYAQKYIVKSNNTGFVYTQRLIIPHRELAGNMIQTKP